MTAKEYLKQAYRLDLRIHSHMEELDRLRDLSTSVGSPGFEEHYNPNRSTEAPFVRYIEKMMTMDGRINAEIDVLVDLKEQIHSVINRVPNVDEKLVLRYRYIQGMTWEQISVEMNADARTIRRWHNTALSHVVVPKDAIMI